MKRRMRKYRIGLTCDFYRFVPEKHEVTNFQNRNLAWLFELFKEVLMQAADADISIISAPRDIDLFRKALGNKDVYAEYIRDPEVAWAQQYEHAKTDLFSNLLDKLLEQDLIIGFEMPPTLRRYLANNNSRYVNLYIHPLRFLKDLCFGATTNCPSIATLLQANQCDQIEITRQVQRYSALFTRLQLPACALPAGVPLLIGQTARDSVLITNGSFVSWENYCDVLIDELAPFDTVAFLEHPYRLSSASVIEFLRGSLAKNVIAIRGNSYGMLFSNRDLPKVITLASSLGVEAEIIGHKSTFLLSDPREKFLIPEIECPITPTLGHALFDAQFWTAIIKGGDLTHVNFTFDSFFIGENYVRNSLDAWSYKGLQYNLTVEPAIKTIVPSTALKQDGLERLAEECSGFSYIKGTPLTKSIVVARNQGTDLRVLGKPIEPGETWEFPFNSIEGAYYLFEGFHPPEKWGVWSSDRHSTLIIPIEKISGSLVRLNIELDIKVFEGIRNDSPVLKISTQTQDIGYFFFRASNINLQKLAFEILTPPSTLQLHFELTHLGCPYEIYGTPDMRQLGFGLARISVSYFKGSVGTANHDITVCKIWGIDPASELACVCN